MPTPLELITDPATLISLGLYIALLTWENVAPARALPRISGWWLRGLVSFALYFLGASYLPLLVADYFTPLRVLDLTSWGTWGGALLLLFTYELLAYAYHRSIHKWDALFRAFHQLHHSAERLDVLGALWFGPLDLIGFTMMSVIAMALVGVTPEAGMVFMLTAFFLAIFQHTNIKTPMWLGYLVQRPESHAHHHARGVHHDNYADLPIIDLLFGTFRNPREFAAQQGYYDGASARVLEMLLLRDVTEPDSQSAPLRPSLLDVHTERAS